MFIGAPVKTRKFTIELPENIVDAAKKHSGKGTTEIIRDLMTDYVRRERQKALLDLRGTLKSALTIEEIRGWED